MATGGSAGEGSEHLKDKLKHPFSELREKLRDTKLHDLKVGLIHKKLVPAAPLAPMYNVPYANLDRHTIGKFANLVGTEGT